HRRHRRPTRPRCAAGPLIRGHRATAEATPDRPGGTTHRGTWCDYHDQEGSGSGHRRATTDARGSLAAAIRLGPARPVHRETPSPAYAAARTSGRGQRAHHRSHPSTPNEEATMPTATGPTLREPV